MESAKIFEGFIGGMLLFSSIFLAIPLLENWSLGLGEEQAFSESFPEWNRSGNEFTDSYVQDGNLMIDNGVLGVYESESFSTENDSLISITSISAEVIRGDADLEVISSNDGFQSIKESKTFNLSKGFQRFSPRFEGATDYRIRVSGEGAIEVDSINLSGRTYGLDVGIGRTVPLLIPVLMLGISMTLLFVHIRS